MKVYVVTEEPDHDNSTILGVYSSLEKAKATRAGNWNTDGFYVQIWGAVAESALEEGYLIFEFELQ
jgi:hypothetical protein